jgi:hypothetical protein
MGAEAYVSIFLYQHQRASAGDSGEETVRAATWRVADNHPCHGLRECQ